MAVDSGASFFHPPREWNSSGDSGRHRNPIWSQLADDRLTASFIADLVIICTRKFCARCFGRRVERVPSRVGLGGVGRYASRQIHHPCRRSRRTATGRPALYGHSELLAGSAASLAQCVGTAVRMTGIPLSEALAMATINPGRFANRSGVIAIGSRADLIRFRWTNEMILEDVWLAGQRMDISQLARSGQGTRFGNG